MKNKILLIIAGLFLLGTSSYAGNQVEVNSTPYKIKVFLQGAELNHSKEVRLAAGVNEIVFTDLPEGIDQSSIQVAAKGDAVILSVVKQMNYLKARLKAPGVITLEDSLKNYEYALGKKRNEKEVYNSEIELLLANKVLSGKDKNITVKELKTMGAYFNSQLTKLKTGILDVDLEVAQLEKDVKRIQDQLNEMNKMRKLPVNEIVVTVSAKKSTSINMDLSYMIYSAGWSPKYDIRVKSINEPSELIYSANVWQNSGIDWKDAEIILSTRSTRHGGTKPELYPWFIDFAKEYGYMKRGGKGMLKTTMDVVAAAPAMEEDNAATMADFMVVNESQLAVEFAPTIKYSIPSDGKPHTVSLHEYELPATYEYYCAPKLNNDAFLLAKLTEWSEYNLLPGKANVYFENSFVGSTFINPNVAEDTLDVSLGRDKNIIVKREMLKDFTEDKFLSSDIERVFAFELSLKNNKKGNIKIILEDQLPISKNEDIEVELIEKSGARYDKKTGAVRWEMKLAPSDIAKKKFIYSVRYPKGSNIPNL